MSRKKKHEHVNHERWLVSYADFITLLFAFFVVLFASSQSDKKKMAEVQKSIQTAFTNMGIFPATSATPNLQNAGDPMSAAIVLGDDLDAPPQVKEDLQRMKRQLDAMLSKEIAQHTVAIRIGRDGLIVSLREAGFFDSGSAAPHADSLTKINAIAAAIAATPYDVRIEGHTDNVPIHTALFASNWELSTARATQLTRVFIDGHHVAPGRLSAAGFAEFHPVASNSTPDGRGQNRRVDIIVLPVVSKHPDPASPTASSAPAPAIPPEVQHIREAYNGDTGVTGGHHLPAPKPQSSP